MSIRREGLAIEMLLKFEDIPDLSLFASSNSPPENLFSSF